MVVHPIKVEFNVTEQIKRYVYAYLIEGNNCYLIDSGVSGCQQKIIDKINQLGRDVADIKGIFLTHAHPDHIGTAAWFKEHTGCMIYASAGEKTWIENIDLQYEERPIPNFYKLAGKSVPVDIVVKDGDCITLEETFSINVIGTPGHSKDEVSYQIEDSLFIGDAIPVKEDIPIYVDSYASMQSLERIRTMKGCRMFYPAWDHMYNSTEIVDKLDAAEDIIKNIDYAVNEVKKTTNNSDEIIVKVCEVLCNPVLLHNPLFKRTIYSYLTGSEF